MLNFFKRKKWNCDISGSFRDEENRARSHAGSNTQVLAENLKKLAKNFYDKNPVEAIEAMQESFSLVVDISKLKWIGFKLNELGFIHESYRMLSLIPIAEFRSASEIKTYKLISNFVKNEVLDKKLDLNGTKSNESNLISDELRKEDSNSNIIDIKHSKTKVIPNIELNSLSSKPNNSFNCQSLVDILSLTDGLISKPNSVYENIYVPRNAKKYIGKLYDDLNGLVINSSLDSQNFVYLDVFTVKYDGNHELFSNLYVRLAYAGKLDIRGCFVFYNEQNKEICKPEFFTKSSTKITIPSDCFKVAFKLRVKGSGNISNLNVIVSNKPYYELYFSPNDFISKLSIPKKTKEKIYVSRELMQIVANLDEQEFEYVTFNKTVHVDQYSRKLAISVGNFCKKVEYCVSAYDKYNDKIFNCFVSRGVRDFYLPLSTIYVKVMIRIKGQISFSPELTLIFSDEYFAHDYCQLQHIDIQRQLQIIKKPVDNSIFNLNQLVLDLVKNNNLCTKLNKELKKIKIACVMDEFTWMSYSPEANMLQLLPKCFESQLEIFKPDLIFFESAWRGAENKWTNCIHKIPNELISILYWCKVNKVSTVFWNKEDPVHFDTFKNVATLFDYVFTYDFNCVQKYKNITRKNNVFFLPMAVQPQMFNPIEKYKRVDAFCFAGSYYKKYIERSNDLNNFVDVLPKYKDLVIYDRQYGKNDDNYKMPDNYKQYIKGNLSYEEIDKAYKGYNYAINLNSIKQANSIARRVFELLACNTITVSNYSFGVNRGFGDLVITSDDPNVIIRKIIELNANKYNLEKFKLLGLRKVFYENTYCDRLKYILSKVSNVDILGIKPKVAIVSFVENNNEVKKLNRIFTTLTYNNKKIFFVSNKSSLKQIVYSSLSSICSELIKFDYIGFMNSSDYYAEAYLDDLVNGFKFSETAAVCKSSYFIYENNSIKFVNNQTPYSFADEIDLNRGLIKAPFFVQFLSDNKLTVDKLNTKLKIKTLVSDIFNYCQNLSTNIKSEFLDYVSDLRNINLGQGFLEMQNSVKNLDVSWQENDRQTLALNATSLYNHFKKCINNEKYKKISFELVDDKLLVESSLNSDEHIYIPLDKEFNVSDLPNHNNEVFINFELGFSTPTVKIAYFFYDINKQKIISGVDNVNTNLSFTIPNNAMFLKFQLRIQSRGVFEIRNLYFDHIAESFPEYFDKNKVLCLTNNYPSYDNLYKNAFVHTRLKSYKSKNLNVTVYHLNKLAKPVFSEFEGIDVIRGNLKYLNEILSRNNYEVVLVHFLDQIMYEALKLLPKSKKIIVWIHGADILKYTTRLFNFENCDINRINKAKAESDARERFWLKILNDIPSNIHLVFVSNWMKNIVENDYSVKLSPEKYSIIPNPIETRLFRYIEKDVEQRYKLLSIRPYATRKYANDLTVKCILELAKRPDFNKFEITIIGDGILFDEILEPLRSYNNIKIIRSFLTQHEIFEYHKNNGIFLVPTRQDAQGVSKDEAMSSGLIPITNAVTAIPEFVDDSCGVLAPAEDYEYMAKKIGEIVDNPHLFKSMSVAAANRVRSQVSSELITSKEISLILGRS